jgi:hypothetical protein
VACAGERSLKAPARSVEFNLIHDVMGPGVLSDGGCVYTLGHQPNTTVYNNICHDSVRWATVVPPAAQSPARFPQLQLRWLGPVHR